VRVALCVLVVVFAAPGTSKAWDSYKLDLGVGTLVPVYIGGQAVLEMPHRILASLEIGWMPKPYVGVVNGVAEAFNAYSSSTGDLINEAIKNSFILRPSIGWRPFESRGFEVMGGYTLVALGGGISAVEAIEAATGKTSQVPRGTDIPLSSVMHCFHVTLGWRWILGEHWVLRANVGYLQAFASHSSIDATPSRASGQAALQSLNAQVNSYLNDVYTTYVKTPTLGVTINYRF
jgi:hypothetical protein